MQYSRFYVTQILALIMVLIVTSRPGDLKTVDDNSYTERLDRKYVDKTYCKCEVR